MHRGGDISKKSSQETEGNCQEPDAKQVDYDMTNALRRTRLRGSDNKFTQPSILDAILKIGKKTDAEKAKKETLTRTKPHLLTPQKSPTQLRIRRIPHLCLGNPFGPLTLVRK